MATKDAAKEKTTKDERTYHSFPTRRRVLEDYLEDIPVPEIAARHNVPVSTIRSWIQARGWKQKKDRLQSESIQAIEDKYKNVIHKNQLRILETKLRTAALIDRAIRTRLLNADGTMKKLSDEQLKNLADAFAKNAQVDAKMVGLLTPQNQMNIIMGSGAMINIGVQGQPVAAVPAPKRESSIDVEVSAAPYGRKQLVPIEGAPF